MSKKKYKRTYYFRILLIVVIILLIIYFIVNILLNIFNKKDNLFSVINNNVNIKLLFDITNNSESDINSIDYYFEEGMSLEDFNSVLSMNNDYIKTMSKYNFISYDFEKKLHYNEIENYLKELNNSDIVNLEIIGSSVDNRNIYGIEIGNGEKKLFLDANIHAAEVSTTSILLKFLIDVVNSYELDENNIKSLLNDVKIVAIPCINPDGYEVYNFGVESLNNKDLWIYQNKDKINFENIKSNANGVDLNRNFPTQNAGLVFKGKKLIKNTSIDKTTQRGKYFNGYTVGSEPEIRAAMYFMIKHYKSTYAYINLHSQGRVLYAGKPNLSNEFNSLTKKFANNISNVNNYRVHGLESEEVGEGNDGSATDFMAELANGFSFSTLTGRLSTDKYINNNCQFVNKYPVVTMEIAKDWTSNPSYFKNEYYNQNLKTLLFDILDTNFLK